MKTPAQKYTRPVFLRLDEPCREAVERLARESRRTIAGECRMAIDAWIATHRKEESK